MIKKLYFAIENPNCLPTQMKRESDAQQPHTHTAGERQRERERERTTTTITAPCVRMCVHNGWQVMVYSIISYPLSVIIVPTESY